MKLKLDANGNVVLQDSKPVYIKDDGTEVAFDAAQTVATITRLNGEAKTHREAKEAAESKVKAYEGITDPKAALAALQTVANLDAKKLVDAGEVDKVRQEAIRATEEKYKPVETERDALRAELHGEKIGGSFARSKFINDKCAIPADLVQARFGSNFALENGKIVAKDVAGNTIYSNAKPGEVADFDEALEILVGGYPYKAQILKGTNANGSGTQQSGPMQNGKPTLTRSQFDSLSPHEQAAKARTHELVD